VAKFIGETNLIEATVVSQSGNSYKVSTVSGEFTGHIGQTDWKPAVGEQVLLSIRPEAWEVVASATTNTTAGKVLEKTYLGQRQQVEVSSPLGHLQVVMLNPKKPLVVGDSLTLTATHEDVIIVPKE
jgi:ABC-type Fe3+/spermidine/putrescine transport system ATPase subunit